VVGSFLAVVHIRSHIILVGRSHIVSIGFDKCKLFKMSQDKKMHYFSYTICSILIMKTTRKIIPSPYVRYLRNWLYKDVRAGDGATSKFVLHHILGP
jgi:hypothetical protein